MSLSDKYKKKAAEIVSERERLAVERAQSEITRIMNTEQFKLSALALPNANMNVDAVILNTVKVTLDPKNALLDTLRAKGFRPAEVRKIIHRLYDTYCKPLDVSSEEQVPYENMLEVVSNYVYMHQELYNTLDPDVLRN